MRACRAESESVRKTAFLGFSSREMMVSVAFSSARTSALQFEHSIPPGVDTEWRFAWTLDVSTTSSVSCGVFS